MLNYKNFPKAIKSKTSEELKEMYKSIKVNEIFTIRKLHKLQWINQELINRGNLYN